MDDRKGCGAVRRINLGPDLRVSTCAAAVLLGGALLSLPGCGGGSGEVAAAPLTEHHAEAEVIAVQVDEARVAPMAALYSTSATLRSDRRATITARTQGVVRELLVEEGDRVEAAQPLAVLEDDELKIQLESASTARKTRQREFERAENLHGQGLLSEEAYETARREADETRHTAELAELELSRTRIRAPFAGRVLTRHLDAGATVQDGTAVYDIADLDPLYADVSVPERHVARLAVGQSVRLTADAFGQTKEARIERIAPLVEPATGTIKVTLAVSVSAGLRPGTFVRVEIVTNVHSEALVVPRSALVAEGRRWHLFRLVADGRVERLEVQRGYEEGDQVEIAGTVEGPAALGVGDRVVHVGASALSDGARVEILSGDGDDAGDTTERDAA